MVNIDRQMFMLKSTHDASGHREAYATKILIQECFWWPGINGDVQWYVGTCHNCQMCQKTVVNREPTVTYTPSIFQTIHINTMHMTPASNGCKYIDHGRCTLLS